MKDMKWALVQYFVGKSSFKRAGLDSVRSDYNWKIPKTLYDDSRLELPGSNFDANVELKRILCRAWMEQPDAREKIVKWVISDWGGIRSNK